MAIALAALGLCLAAAILMPQWLGAQIEGDRGIAPVASNGDIQVDGIHVDATGRTGEEARASGWKQAQKLAWAKVGGPTLGEGQLAAMVSAIIVEHEEVGPRRYIATLGVVFDRGKTGDFIASNSGAGFYRSAPLLVIPILDSGGTRQVFEVRTAWQRAWAAFQTSASSIDYVRPNGAGADSLLIDAGQAGRRSRLWWRTVLDRFDAADVIMPIARLERQWPGGPVKGTFTARYGPDNTFLDSFTLEAADDAGIPRMLNQALVRLDGIYRDALSRGVLQPDPTLTADERAYARAIAAVKAQMPAAPISLDGFDTGSGEAEVAVPGAVPSQAAAPPVALTVQFASPDAGALDGTLAAVRGVAGVQGVAATSLAVGGTSVMRVTFAGDAEALATALRGRGYQVTVSGGTLSIRR